MPSETDRREKSRTTEEDLCSDAADLHEVKAISTAIRVLMVLDSQKRTDHQRINRS